MRKGNNDGGSGQGFESPFFVCGCGVGFFVLSKDAVNFMPEKTQKTVHDKDGLFNFNVPGYFAFLCRKAQKKRPHSGGRPRTAYT